MAVSLPSDLVMDVIRNAQPARRSAAEARLQVPGSDFAEVVADTRSAPAASAQDESPSFPAPSPVATRAAGSRAHGDGASAYQGFERMVLRNLFETLLPSDESGAFGEGPSAGVWRSMAADQLAGVYAESGGIGIASLLSRKADGPDVRREAQWPYFAVDAIESFSGES